MIRIAVFIVLFILFGGYSALIYTYGTESKITFKGEMGTVIDKGKMLYQEYNCTACHQLFGLGGFLGPELTTAWSDPSRGEAYMRSLLKYGSTRMPDFKFSDQQIDNLVYFLKYVDSIAKTKR